MSIALGVTVAYLLVSLAVGMASGGGEHDDADSYVAGDRGLGPVLMYFIMGGTLFSSFAFLGLPGWAMSRGVAALYILGYGTLGMVPLYFMGPRAARLGAHYGYVTQAEMVAGRFGSRALSGWMGAVAVLACIPYLALQIKGSGYVVEVVSEGLVPAWLGGGIVYLVVLTYVLRSGVLGVAWTNTLQGAFMLVMAWVLGLYLPWKLYGGVGPMFDQIAATRPELLVPPGLQPGGGAWPWSEYSSAVVVSTVGAFAWPHFFMKAFTARDGRVLQTTALAMPTFQLFLVPLLIIGFCGVMFTPAPARPDQILPHMLMNLELPAIVVGLFCAGALAASMSSGDSMLHAAASIAVRDGGLALRGHRPDTARETRQIRICAVLVMVLSYVVATLYQGSLVGLLLSTYGAVVQFAPVLVATLYWRRAHGGAVFGGLVVGTVVTVLLTFAPHLRPWAVHPGAYGLAANVLVLLAGSMALGRDEASDWLQTADGSSRR